MNHFFNIRFDFLKVFSIPISNLKSFLKKCQDHSLSRLNEAVGIADMFNLTKTNYLKTGFWFPPYFNKTDSLRSPILWFISFLSILVVSLLSWSKESNSHWSAIYNNILHLFNRFIGYEFMSLDLTVICIFSMTINTHEYWWNHIIL